MTGVFIINHHGWCHGVMFIPDKDSEIQNTADGVSRALGHST